MGSDYLDFLHRNESESFAIIRGSRPLIISAPHNVEQIRFGKPKYSEPNTGALAFDLATKLSAYAIIKTSCRNDDANYDLNCDYKKAVADLIARNDIRLLIDLHEMSSHRAECFDIGTAHGENLVGRSDLLDCIASRLRERFSEVWVDKIFTARHLGTVSRYISGHCSIPCIQLEINFGLFNQGLYGDILGALIEFANEVKGL